MRRSICSDDRFWRDIARECGLTKSDGSKIKNRKDYMNNVASLYSGVDIDIVNSFINKSTRLRLNSFEEDTLSDMVGNLINLRELSIYMPKIKYLPGSIKNLKNLECLVIDDSSITILPDSICKLSKLRIINISGSELEKLPKCIGDLQRLESLIVMNSNITTVPNSIGKLRNLKTLMLEYNKLQTLPDSIADIVCKEKEIQDSRYEHSSHNRPTWLIKWQYKSDCLREIFVQGNPKLELSSYLEDKLDTHIRGYLGREIGSNWGEVWKEPVADGSWGEDSVDW